MFHVITRVSHKTFLNKTFPQWKKYEDFETIYNKDSYKDFISKLRSGVGTKDSGRLS